MSCADPQGLLPLAAASYRYSLIHSLPTHHSLLPTPHTHHHTPMATLALAVAGAAVGSALLPAGLTILGATLTGATLGSQVGALAGSFIDQSLLGASGQLDPARTAPASPTCASRPPPKARPSRASTAARASAARSSGPPISRRRWSSRAASGGGKGGSSQSQASAGIEYRYFANFAVALAEGPISGLGRVWADGQELDLSTVTYRLYTGSEDQLPDSLIEAKEGAGNAPAYRGLAYIVFERMALAAFGNRIPQLSFEVHRAVDAFDGLVRAVCLIPGAGEFVYAAAVHHPQGRRRHQRRRRTCTPCRAAPTGTSPSTSCRRRCPMRTGLARRRLVRQRSARRHLPDPPRRRRRRQGHRAAHLVRGRRIARRRPPRQPGRGPRGLRRHAVGPDRRRRHPGPRTRAASPSRWRPSSSWTCRPATRCPTPTPAPPRSRPIPGAAASPSRPPPASPAPPTRPPPRPRRSRPSSAPRRSPTSPSPATASSTPARPSGPTAASSCTTRISPPRPAASTPSSSARSCAASPRCATAPAPIRSSPALVQLAADVKAVLGSATKVTYAADWSEYFGHQPADGSGDVYFHLDPLWSSADIDAVGIDVYWPLADWRDGADHARPPGRRALDLRSRLPARQHLRRRGLRLVLRQPRRPRRADAHAHHRRRRQALGVPLQGHPQLVAEPALQPPRRRRIRHAHRLGAAVQALLVHRARLPRRRQGRQPAQRLRRPEELRVAPALLLAAAPATTSCSAATCRPSTRPSIPSHPDYVAGANPTSAVYSAPHARSRPHPRLLLGRAPLPGLPRQHRRVGRRRQLAARPLGHRPPRQRAARRHRLRHPRRLRLSRPRRQRAHRLARRLPHRPRALRARGPAAAGACLLHRRARERGPHRLRPPRLASSPSPSSTPDDLVESRPGASLATLTRAQETDLPSSAKLTFISAAGSYPAAVEEARRLAGHSGRVAIADLPLVLEAEQAAQMAEVWLFEAWAARERAAFALPPSRLALEPGDIVSFAADGRSRLLRITEIGEHGARDIEARGIDPEIYSGAAPAVRPPPGGPPVIVGQPFVLFLDLPLLRGTEPRACRLRRRRPEPMARRHRLLPLAGSLQLPLEGDGASPRPSPASPSIRCPPPSPPASTAPARSASSSTRARSPPPPSWRCSPAPTSRPSRTPTANGRCCNSNPPC